MRPTVLCASAPPKKRLGRPGGGSPIPPACPYDPGSRLRYGHKNNSIFYIPLAGGRKPQQILLSDLAGDAFGERAEVGVAAHEVHFPAARAGQKLEVFDREGL